MEENSRLLVSKPRGEIVFVRPEKGSQSRLSLSNPGLHNVYFKVLTTDPLAFCVKPKMGFVEPGKATEVWITLRNDDVQYYIEKQPKFKILTIENRDTIADFKVLWNGDKVETTSSLRFSCSFVQPDQDPTKADRAEDAADEKSPSPHTTKEESQVTNYETSGSSTSITCKEGEGKSNLKSANREPRLKKLPMKHMFIGVIAMIVAYVTAMSLLREYPLPV